MKLIVAIPSQNKKEVFSHTGKCTNFIIYHLEDNIITEKRNLSLTKDETLHEFFHNINSEINNPLQGVNMLLTGGIGEGAIHKLRADGIQTHIIDEKNPDEVIKKLINGTLTAKTTSSCGCSCGSNHQHHE